MGNDFMDLFGDWRPDDEGRPASESGSGASEYHVERELNEREVRVVNVFEITGETPSSGVSQSSIFVLLRDNRGRQMKIFVARDVAYSISMALSNRTPDRPFTHDLLKNMLDRLAVSVDHIVIDDLLQDTFYAKIALTSETRNLEIDARPSDAIALALRYRAPIYVADAVMEAAQDE